MRHYLFTVMPEFELDLFESSDAFMEQDMDFYSVCLRGEEDLICLLELLRMAPKNVYNLEANRYFDKVYDLSGLKFPEMNEIKFDQLYKKWIYLTGRTSDMDEYGQLTFINGYAREWNNIGCVVVAQESVT